MSSLSHPREHRAAGDHAPASASAPARSIWIHRPWLDLLVGCGGWSAPLLLISYLLVDQQARQWAAVFYALALVCNYPHYMATIHRAYGRAEDRSRYKLFTYYVTAALVAVGIAAHFKFALLAWLFTAYVTWSPWHYTGQNFGLSMMFLRRAGVDVTPRDRQWLHAAFVASYVMLLAAFNEGVSQDPLTLSAGLPMVVTRTIEIGAGLVFLVAGVMTFRSLAARGGASRGALLPAITLFTTQALWFVVPIAVSWVSTAATPQTRYSTGILAVMHSAQYLWITHHFARKDAASGTANARGWSGWAYWTTLVAGGVALFIPGPWLASYGGKFDFTSSMLIVTAVVNIHHFILDGVVWKLRDPRVSKVLTSTQQEGAAASAGSTRETGTRLKVLVRAAAVVSLIALAGVDQWRYVLALGGAEGADRGALERASALNPFDSSVQLRLASTARASGDRAAMERDLRRAVAVNSYTAAPYHALERFLIESERWQDAYTHCQLLLEKWPREIDTLVNAGVLARKLNDPAAAERWWRRALDVDDSLRDVHLYLAELLDGSTRTAEALPHYQRHLELVARETTANPSAASRQAAERTALVVIKFGDALGRTNQADLAASQYDLAATIARQAGLTEIEALARERRASSPDAAR